MRFAPMSKVFTGAGIDYFGGCLIIFSVSAFKLSSVFWNFDAFPSASSKALLLPRGIAAR